MEMPRGINLILAIITTAIGVLGIFGSIIGFTLPKIPGIIIYSLIVIAGIVIILDGLLGVGMGMVQMMPRGVNFMVGLLVLLAGAALLIGQFGIIPLPAIPTIVEHVILLLAGAIMLLDGILGARNM